MATASGRSTRSTSRYVSAINSSIAETSPAGSPSAITWFYQGPSINADANAATLLTSDAAIQQVFNWFNANGGANRPVRSRRHPWREHAHRRFARFAELDSSTPPASAALLGQRGSVRVDYVFRDFNDFYITRTDLSTGKVTNALGRRSTST